MFDKFSYNKSTFFTAIAVIGIILIVFFFNKEKFTQGLAFQSQLNRRQKAKFTFHTVDFCMYCIKMEPEWIKLEKMVNKTRLGNYVELIKNDEKKNKTPGVFTYPQLRLLLNGQMVEYTGERNADDIYDWLNSKVLQSHTAIF